MTRAAAQSVDWFQIIHEEWGIFPLTVDVDEKDPTIIRATFPTKLDIGGEMLIHGCTIVPGVFQTPDKPAQRQPARRALVPIV